MGLANDTNADGKRYDSLFRFTLAIHANREDSKGRIIERMRSGTVTAFDNIPAAVKAQEEFHELCSLTDGEFSSYGMTAVIDTRDGLVHNPRHIYG